MHPFYAAFLGLIQGLTEFLPVSSSGHLVILQHIFGMRAPELLFDVSVHLGTLMAVMIYFRTDVAAIMGALARSIGTMMKKMKARQGAVSPGPNRVVPSSLCAHQHQVRRPRRPEGSRPEENHQDPPLPRSTNQHPSRTSNCILFPNHLTRSSSGPRHIPRSR